MIIRLLGIIRLNDKKSSGIKFTPESIYLDLWFFSFLMLAFLIRTAGVPVKNVWKFICVNYILHLDYLQKQSNEYVFALALGSELPISILFTAYQLTNI